jgi:hypothetical protein
LLSLAPTYPEEAAMTTTTVTDGDIFLVPVPKEHLAAVYKVLAQATNPVLTPPPADDPDRQWTLQELRQLKSLIATRPAALELHDLTAANPGESMTFPELLEKTGVTREAARGQLASLTIIAKKRFNHDRWPVEVYWNGPDLSYRMSAAIAELWRQT